MVDLTIPESSSASESPWSVRRMRRKHASNYAVLLARIACLEAEREQWAQRISQLERIFLLVDWQKLMSRIEEGMTFEHAGNILEDFTTGSRCSTAITTLLPFAFKSALSQPPGLETTS